MSRQTAAAPQRDTPVERRIVTAVLVAVLLLFFRGPLLSGLTRFDGDSYDGLIEIAILEHWYGVVARGDGWNLTGYFFPYADTLGYNDTSVVPGVPYVLARLLRADPFVAALIAHMAMKALGFLGMYLLLRRGVAIRFWLATAGAALFAGANASLLHIHHAQLLSVGLLPWLGLAAIRVERALVDGDGASLWRWGAAFALGYGVVAFNAFYGAWFFGFFLLILVPVGIAMMGHDRRGAFIAGARHEIMAIIALGALTLLATVPLLVVYLPKVAAGARHGFDRGAARRLIGATGIFNVGTGNLVWGRLLDTAAKALTGRPPLPGEARFGLPWGLLVVLTIAIIWCIRHRRDQRLAAATSIALLIVLLLAARWPGGFTLWRLVYTFVPGADSIRVVSRLLLFALVPIVLIVFVFFDRSGRRPPLVGLIVVFLLVEEVQLDAPLLIDGRREMTMLAQAGAPPASCRSFAIVSARPREFPSLAEARAIAATWNDEPAVMLRDNYRHNVDAMMIAAFRGRPTVNGFSTFNPPDAVFFGPDSPDYAERLRTYVTRHALSGVCLLDVRRTPAWQPLTPAAAAPAS